MPWLHSAALNRDTRIPQDANSNNVSNACPAAAARPAARCNAAAAACPAAATACPAAATAYAFAAEASAPTYYPIPTTISPPPGATLITSPRANRLPAGTAIATAAAQPTHHASHIRKSCQRTEPLLASNTLGSHPPNVLPAAVMPLPHITTPGPAVTPRAHTRLPPRRGRHRHRHYHHMARHAP